MTRHKDRKVYKYRKALGTKVECQPGKLQIALRLNKSLFRELVAAAKASNISVNSLVAAILEHHLAKGAL